MGRANVCVKISEYPPPPPPWGDHMPKCKAMIGLNERPDQGLVLFYRIGQNECTLNRNVVNEDI